MDDEVDAAVVVEEDVLVLGEVALSGRRRDRLGERRTRRLTPRFTAGEVTEIDVAAASVGMTPNGFCAEVVLRVVRRLSVSYGAVQEREALARLQRELFEVRRRSTLSRVRLSCAGGRCATLTRSSTTCTACCGNRYPWPK